MRGRSGIAGSVGVGAAAPVTYKVHVSVQPLAKGLVIHSVGDSTMANYDPAVTPNQRGWMQMFPELLTGDFTVANAAIQTHASTIVAYLGSHRADAAHVAKALSLPASSIARADQDAIGVCAGGAPGNKSCAADVIVTVGTDLAGVAASAGSG